LLFSYSVFFRVKMFKKRIENNGWFLGLVMSNVETRPLYFPLALQLLQP